MFSAVGAGLLLRRLFSNQYPVTHIIMYNYKEKIKHFRNLSASVHARTDLEYLKTIDPRNDQIPSFEHAPERNADKILYALLDITTFENIRNNRRDAAIKLEKEVTEGLAAQKELERLQAEKEAAEKAEKEYKLNAVKNNLPAYDNPPPPPDEDAEAARLAEDDKLRKEALEALKADAPSELEKQTSDLESQLEYAEAERDEALEEKEELEEKLEEAENALEETKAEIDAEKKSEVKPEPKAPAKTASSKKKPSTQKSTGKISATKTSR